MLDKLCLCCGEHNAEQHSPTWWSTKCWTTIVYVVLYIKLKNTRLCGGVLNAEQH